MRSARLLKLGLVTLTLAAVLHVAAVWLVPIGIMRIFMSRVISQLAVNRVATPPLPTDTSRSVVMPSPDLLYGMCVYDVGAGPVLVSIKPPKTYWSLSLFDTNTDNFFRLNAAGTKGNMAELVLGKASDAADAKARYPSASFVETLHTRGVVLARILVLDKSNMAEALAAQKSVECKQIDRRG